MRPFSKVVPALFAAVILLGWGCQGDDKSEGTDNPSSGDTTQSGGSNYVETKGGADISMVFAEGDTLTIGCIREAANYSDSCRTGFEAAEMPSHRVRLNSFYIGKYPITQRQWKTVMGDGNNPSRFTGDELPVDNVSWNDAQEFINKLNKLAGKAYRLPTNAEWEYAARGGTESLGYKYSGGNDIGDIAWYKDNSGDRTKPVGTKKANELGIYDMSGNIYEWVNDWHGDYYQNQDRSPIDNPLGPPSGSGRVLRGGCFSSDTRSLRSSARGYDAPSNSSQMYGFRIAAAAQ
jgi:formylglycine-generating enzyme required for sulfatase activity